MRIISNYKNLSEKVVVNPKKDLLNSRKGPQKYLLALRKP